MKNSVRSWERVKEGALLRSRVIGLSLAFALSACSATQEVNPPSEQHVEWARFTKGEAQLPCTVSCSGRYGSNRRELKELYARGLWELLAERVLYIGYQNDQSWFYLGRAAEGLGFPEAALSYYSKVNNARIKCGGVLNTCDGLVFPRDMDNRVSIIQQQKTIELERQQMAAGKPAKRTSMSRAEKVGGTAQSRKSTTAQARKPTTTPTRKSDRPTEAAKDRPNEAPKDSPTEAAKVKEPEQATSSAPTEQSPVGSLIDM